MQCCLSFLRFVRRIIFEHAKTHCRQMIVLNSLRVIAVQTVICVCVESYSDMMPVAEHPFNWNAGVSKHPFNWYPASVDPFLRIPPHQVLLVRCSVEEIYTYSDVIFGRSRQAVLNFPDGVILDESVVRGGLQTRSWIVCGA